MAAIARVFLRQSRVCKAVFGRYCGRVRWNFDPGEYFRYNEAITEMRISMLSEKITDIQKEGEAALSAVKTMAELEAWEVKYLGRKSELGDILKGLKDLSVDEKRIIGPLGNAAKQSLAKAFAETKASILEKRVDWEGERIDVTAPGVPAARGHLHPITRLEHEIEDIFASMG